MYHQRHVIGRGPRRQITLTPTALAMMNSLTRTRKALVVCALVDISYATVDELFSRNFPQVLGQIRSRVIYLDANRTRFVDVRFTFEHRIKITDVLTG